MEYEKIKQLIEDVGNSKLTTVDIEFSDGTKISMKKETEVETVKVVEKISETATTEVVASNEEKEPTGNIVKSPMVGTFYMKPSPTSDPFVQKGNDIKVGDTLCIIEAMKLMNEIESEFSGKVVEIFVEDGKPVEYGTPLFRIE